MRNFSALLFFIFFALIGFSGCNLINPPEVPPTYVHIDSFAFTNSRDTLGTASHRITNVYVYFNSEPVGVFDLPVTFPVKATGAGTLSVLPGIDFDGLTGYETSNPMFSGDTMHLVPNPGNTINYSPRSSYKSGTIRRFLEDFESGTGRINGLSMISGDTGILLNTNLANVFEGKADGMIRLISGKDSSTIGSTPMEIPYDVESYIELNYKGNMPIYIGMTVNLNSGGTYSEYMIALKPQTDWKKIYIGTRDFVANHQGTNYQILLKTIKPSDLNDGVVYIDNIKMLSF